MCFPSPLIELTAASAKVLNPGVERCAEEEIFNYSNNFFSSEFFELAFGT
jgi:hypothetical protein